MVPEGVVFTLTVPTKGTRQPRTQALHCFYRDQRQLIIQARKGARSTHNEGSAWQKMQIFVVTYRISCF